MKLSEGSKGSPVHSDSSTGSSTISTRNTPTRSRTIRNSKRDNEFEPVSPELAFQNTTDVRPSTLNGPRVVGARAAGTVKSTGGTPKSTVRRQSTSDMLQSWRHDRGRDSTKPQILWALDNMADKLTEDTEWMEIARAIWSRWKKASPAIRAQYTTKARINRKGIARSKLQLQVKNLSKDNSCSVAKKVERPHGLVENDPNHSLHSTSADSTTTISNIRNPLEYMPIVSGLQLQPSSFYGKGGLMNSQQLLATSTAEGAAAASIYTLPIPLVASILSSNLSLPFPTTTKPLPSTSNVAAPLSSSSIESPTCTTSDSKAAVDAALITSPSTAHKLQASLPFSIESDASLLKVKDLVPPQSVGIPIMKVENPLFPTTIAPHSITTSTDNNSSNTVPTELSLLPPTTLSINSSFCISNILAANPPMVSFATKLSPRPTQVTTIRENSKPTRKGKRLSPYRVTPSNGSPIPSPLTGSSTSTTSSTSSTNERLTNAEACPSSSVAAVTESNPPSSIQEGGPLVHSSPGAISLALVGSSDTTTQSHQSRPTSLSLQNTTSTTTTTTSSAAATNSPSSSTSPSICTARSISRTAPSSKQKSSQKQLTDDNAGGNSCPLTVVTDEWKRLLEKQLRQNKIDQSVPIGGRTNGRNKCSITSGVVKNESEFRGKRKQKKSNVLSRPPMKVQNPTFLNPIIFGHPISQEVQSSVVSTPRSLPPSPLTSPSYALPPSPYVAFRPTFNQQAPQNPQQVPQNPAVRATSPALFVPRGMSDSPSPASTPSVFAGDALTQLKASTSDIKRQVMRLSTSTEKLTPEEQVKIDARNYADLERQYWRCLLTFEEQKKTMAILKERMVKARAEQQLLFLGDERFNRLKEMIVNPVWEPMDPDLLDSLESSQIGSSTEVKIKGSFDKPVLENEDVYKYLLHSFT